MTDNELSALVAELVMGWKHIGFDDYTSPKHGPVFDDWESKGPHERLVSPDGKVTYLCRCGLSKGDKMPDYANEIAAAFQVVEHFQSRGFGWRIQLEPDCRTWRVCNHDDGLFLAGWKDRHGYISETATTAPRAICLAALMAVGVEAEAS